MKKNKKIMIALDYHPSSKRIIEDGYFLAKDMKATVVLLHVRIDLVNYFLTYKKMSALKLDSIDNFGVTAHDFLEKSKKSPADDMIQVIVKQGDFAEAILKTAKEMDVDIIVMGSHNTQWLEEIVMGRVTDDDLQQTEIPILIIPTRKKDEINTVISLEN